MGSTWLLMKRGLRQSPSQAIAMVLLSALSATLLILGVLNSTQFPRAYDERLAELNAPTAILSLTESDAADQARALLEQDPRVSSVESEQMFSTLASFDDADGEINSGVNLSFFDVNASLKAGTTAITAEASQRMTDGVFVPRQLHDTGGYDLGDKIVFDTAQGTLAFRIQGFFERPFFSSTTWGVIGIGLPSANFSAFANEHPSIPEETRLLTSLDSPSEASAVVTDVQEALAKSPTFDASQLNVWQLELYAMSTTTPASTTAALLLAFVTIMTLVVTVVIMYLCGQRIQRDLTGVGVMKAFGMTGGRIRAALIAMFLGLAMLGTGIGVGIAYLVAPSIAHAYSLQTGFDWQPTFSWVALGIAVLVATVSTVFATMVGTRKAVRFAPVAALRGTISTHSFSRNVVPLAAARGPLTLLLAAKSFLQNRVQAISVGLVVMLFAFAGVFAVALAHNVSGDSRTFTDLISGGVPDVTAEMTPEAVKETTSRDRIVDQLEDFDGVESAYPLQGIQVTSESQDQLTTSVFVKASDLPYDPSVEGRLPEHKNEIAVSVRFATLSDTQVGDEVRFTYDGNTQTLLITGIIQGSRSLGMLAYLSEAGLQNFDPQASVNAIALQAKPGADLDALTVRITQDFSDELSAIVNIGSQVESELGVYQNIVNILMQAVLIITLLVITLVLWLMVATLLRERRRDFGVMRAIGYRWPGLAAQVVLSYFPPLLTGAVIGSLLGAMSFNPLLTVMLLDLGISKASFEIIPWQVAAIMIVLPAFGVLLILGLASRIRRISTSELIRE